MLNFPIVFQIMCKYKIIAKIDWIMFANATKYQSSQQWQKQQHILLTTNNLLGALWKWYIATDANANGNAQRK